jgi:2-oxoglutarate ferredoxin oxidoreductase subunit gamma
MIRKEIRISGFGGQGVVLSGNIIGKAASVFSKGHAALTQNYGPESRGGSCTAEVVISDEPVEYPYVTEPQVQITLSQEAYTKFGRNPPPGSLVIVDADLVKVDPEQKPQPMAIAATRLASEELKRPVVANILMLGYLAAVSDVVSADALKKSVLDSIPAGTETVNMKAFELGYSHGIKQKKNE